MAITPVITENSEINPTYLTPDEYTRILAAVGAVAATPNKYKGILEYSMRDTFVPANIHAAWENGAFFYSTLDNVFYVLEKENNAFIAVGAPAFAGEYQDGVRYHPDQLVTYDGQLYCNKQCGTIIAGGPAYTVNVLPTNTACWLPVALDTGGGGGALFLDTDNHNYCGTDDEFLSNTTGQLNIALGQYALMNNTAGGTNTAIGSKAIQANTTGMRNVGVGADTLQNNMTGNNNTAVGYIALSCKENYPNLSNNTAVGCAAGYLNGAYVNTTCLGNQSVVTGSNQVQLGNTMTTTYVFGTVQNRSDARDKANVVDSNIGLDFILGLRPVEGVWDLRDDYVEYTEVKAVDDKGVETVTLERKELERDGSKKRSRKHQWFIAQEVKELCDRLGVDFGGYQDHSKNGGEDVLSLGYDEFIPPAVKAIQECWQRLDKLEERISKLEQ